MWAVGRKGGVRKISQLHIYNGQYLNCIYIEPKGANEGGRVEMCFSKEMLRIILLTQCSAMLK